MPRAALPRTRLLAPALGALTAIAVAVSAWPALAEEAPDAGTAAQERATQGDRVSPVTGIGPDGTATMHGDAASSDTTIHPGPGSAGVRHTFAAKQAACPTVLADSQGRIWSLCTQIFGRAPVVNLLDPGTGATLASLPLTKGALLGGVYAYLDDHDRLVLVDGRHRLLKIAATRGAAGAWGLAPEVSIDVAPFVTADGTDTSDAVVGLTRDRHGHIWLVTRQGKVGVLDSESLKVGRLRLPEGERVDNSISSAGTGVAVASSHALYLLDDPSDGTPRVVWRKPYDRGSARKPGQLSWGTGATPTFFGPATGEEYLTITDNADDQEHLLVHRTRDGSLVCSPAVFRPGASGTENSAMAHGRTVIVASTYGYPYPALPEGAGTSVPASAPFTVGGMERFDVAEDESGCRRAWAAPVLSSAVPRWSLKDSTVYTVERPAVLGGTGPAFDAITVDPGTGAVTSRTRIAGTGLRDTLEMVGTITPDGTWWQGAMTGVFRMTSAQGTR